MGRKIKNSVWLVIAAGYLQVFSACGDGGGDIKSTRDGGSMAPMHRGVRGGACLKVVNGIEILRMPGVVMIDVDGKGLCTGTYLGPNVVLTAAHCIDDSPTGSVKIWGKTPPVAVFHAGIAGEAAFDKRPSLDVAFLLMQENSSRTWRKIASVPPKPGDRMTVVGYGRTAVTNGSPQDGRLRYGSNTIAVVSPQEALMAYDAPKEYVGLKKGEESMGAPGDSGGPILVNDAVVGLTSGGGENSRGDIVGLNFLLYSAPGLKADCRKLKRGLGSN